MPPNFPRKYLTLGLALFVGLFAALWIGRKPAPSSPQPSKPVARVISSADRINYLLASSKWILSKQELVVSESVDKKEVIASCRSLMNELKALAFDDEKVPDDFKKTYLRWVAANEEGIDLLEQVPDIRNTMEVLGWAAKAGWNYAFDAGDPQKDLKARSEHLAVEMRQSLSSMDQIAVGHGARTDWDTLPKVMTVVEGGFAEKAGVRPGDFFFVLDGVKLFRSLPSTADGKPRKATFLTRNGMVEMEIPSGARFGVEHDTVCNQPPVVIRLDPFAIYSGYYVTVISCSQNLYLEQVVVTYSDANGRSRSQAAGSLAAKGFHELDPSKIDWTVGKGQTITVSAKDYCGRVFEVSRMIKK